MQQLGTNADEYRMEGILSEEVDEYWHLIAGRIRRALEAGNSMDEVESIRGGIMDQVLQLWVVWHGETLEAVGVSRIEPGDKADTLVVVAVEGRHMERWLGLFERTLRVFAVAKGCKFIALEGRRGWVKTLKELQWKEASVKMFKEL